MSTDDREVTLNAIAKLVGWADEGGGKIELMADVGKHRLGQRFTVHVRQVAMGRQPANFDHLKKTGLRTGGMVLLRKIHDEGEGAISCKSVETVIDRDTSGLPYVVHDAAVHILPPPTGTAMVKECIVAFAAEAIRTKAVSEALVKVKPALEQACQFGKGGLILTGEDRDGDVNEVIVGGVETADAETVLSDFIDACPKEIIQSVRKSRKPWIMAAFFRGEVDIDRSSRLSAQRANLDYGNFDEPSWTKANVVLRAFADSWLVCDASPAIEKSGEKPQLLIDLD